jgi:dienelactone hydrolase
MTPAKFSHRELRRFGTSRDAMTGLLVAATAAVASEGCVTYGAPGDASGSGAGGNHATTTSSQGAGGGTGDGGGTSDGGAGSRCTATATTVTCTSQNVTVSDSLTMRSVYFQTPLGMPPAPGWPTVVYFQGSLVAGHTAFSAVPADPFGMFELTLTIKALLDAGYAVLAPDAATNGATFWETNIPPCATAWTGCPDDVLMKNLLAGISGGSFGPLSGTRLYAMGISSGGFMTSRMAVSYPGKFRALADHSGSYATCSDVCIVPPLPAKHPPTLFLHGDTDVVVPITAIQPYIDALTAAGFESKLVTDPTAGHQWLTEAPQAIPAWFDAHP